MSSVKSQIQFLIKKTLLELGVDSGADLIVDVSFPVNEEFGDLTSNIAMVLYPQLKRVSANENLLKTGPRGLAEQIAGKINEKIGVLSSKKRVESSEDVSNSNQKGIEKIDFGNKNVNFLQDLPQNENDQTGSVFSIDKTLKKVEVAGPGFLNFTLSDEFLYSQIYLNDQVNLSSKKQVERSKGNENSNNDDFKNLITQSLNSHPKKRVIVEYSSPNIAKPFTVGHLRSTIIGDAVARILEYQGYKVFRDNHLGDWGTQFGKQIYAIKYLGEGEEKNLEQIENSDNPVKELVKLYVEFHKKAEEDPNLEEQGRAWFKKLEDGDQEARELWQKCIDWSWKEFNRIYELLGVSFTENGGRGYGESYFEDKMKSVIEELESNNMLQEGKEGAKLVFFEEEKLPPLMILKGDGATLYATRDLATDKWRLSHYGKDITIINEVGVEQELYFRQVFEIEQMLGWFDKSQRIHIKHGHFRFSDKKMSTRKGNVIWLEDVVDEAIRRAFYMQKIENEFPDSTTITSKSKKISLSAQKHLPGFAKRYDLAIQVGVGALKWNDLKSEPQRDIIFDWDEILNMQGNSGPYIQYTYARSKSVLRKANYSSKKRVESSVDDTNLNHPNGNNGSFITIDLNREERAVLNQLWKFSDAVARSTDEFAPHHIATYLFELAQRFNSFYNKHHILNKVQTEETSEILDQIRDVSSVGLRLGITNAVAQTLKSGLYLLGIEAPEEM